MRSTVDYHAYLNSDAWKQKRSIALRGAEYRCQVCNRDGQLDVHHRTYERLGNELPQDLVVLCRECHQLFHSNGTLTKSENTKWPLGLTVNAAIAILCTLAAGWSYVNMAQWSTYEADPFNYMWRYVRFWGLATLAACFAFSSSWIKIALGSVALFGAIYFLVIA